MPSLTPFFCNNKQINVFIGDGDFYACDYYDRFGHHSTSCTEPQFYLDFCNERGIPCEPIIKFLEYIKLMDSEFSFDIPLNQIETWKFWIQNWQRTINNWEFKITEKVDFFAFW